MIFAKPGSFRGDIVTEIKAENKRTNSKSLQTLTMSMIIFGTIGICRRYIPLPSEVLACGRGIMGGVFLLLVLRIRGKKLCWNLISRKNFLLLALTGGLIGFNWILLFEAYRFTTVAIATLCYYMQPVIVMILSPLILKEKISSKQVICIIVSVTGMILVSGILTPSETAAGTGNLKGVLLALGAAVLYASVVLLNKHIAGIPPYEKTIIQLFSSAAVMFPYMAAARTLHTYPLTDTQAILFLTVGIVHTGIAYLMYFGSIENLPAKTCALLSYIDPVSAVILSALFLREPMTGFGICGTIMIIGSAIESEGRCS